MFINWLIGVSRLKNDIEDPKVYPVVFSIHKNEIELLLDWMKNHNCPYMENNRTKVILKEYTNEEIIKNGFLSMAFEQYGNDGSKAEGDISFVLMPSVLGTRYKLCCKCGEEIEPCPLYYQA